MSGTKNGSKSDELLADLERWLDGALRPVAPPGELLDRLRESIHIPDREEIALRLRDWQRLMLVLAYVFTGAVAVITVARAMYYLAGRRHMG
jgi:hypothetical protein